MRAQLDRGVARRSCSAPPWPAAPVTTTIPDRPARRRPAAASKVNLTFGVWGTKHEIDAYQGVVDTYNATNDEAQVKIKAYATHDDLMAALDSGEVPDVFLVSRSDLADLLETRSSTSRSATCSTTATSTSVTATRGRRSRPSPATASCSACPTASRRWSSTTTPTLVDFEAMADARSRRTHRRRRGPHQEADLDLRAVPGRRRVRQPAAARHRRLLHRADAARAWRRSSTPAAARSSTTTTSRPRWPSPPTTRKSALEKVLPTAARPEADADARAARREDARWSGSARASSA